MVPEYILLIILGVATILLDMHVVAFITPIGVFFIVYGIFLSFGFNHVASFSIGVLSAIISYFLIGRYIKKDIRDIGKKKYSFELKGKIATVKRISKNYIIVELEGEDWLALPSKEGIVFQEGEKVIVVDVDGIKLKIDKYK